jgi:hypothetical protein
MCFCCKENSGKDGRCIGRADRCCFQKGRGASGLIGIARGNAGEASKGVYQEVVVFVNIWFMIDFCLTYVDLNVHFNLERINSGQQQVANP